MTTATETPGPTPTPIPPAPHFPVAWEEPADAHRLWQREVMHVPRQATALDWEYQRAVPLRGFNHGCEHYELPVRNRWARFNTWVYQAIGPVSLDPEELARLGRRAEENLGAALGAQLEKWEQESLPELRRMYELWESFDLEGSSLAGLAAHVDDTLELAGRAFEIHFETVFVVILAMSLFDDFYRELFGGETFDSFRLLQGFDNMSLRADRAIQELSRSARRSPEVVSVIECSAAGETLARLAESEEGRAFLADVDAYLAEWGRRLEFFVSPSTRSYVEDPTTVLTTLKDALSRPDRDFDRELGELAAEREQAVAAARERLDGFPEPVREQFELLLRAAQVGTVLQEDHNYFIDQRVTYEARRVFLAAGRKLAAAGAIAAADDVFHLTADEIRAAAAAPADLRPVVAERRAELERWARVEQPPVLGALPPGPPPDDAMGRAIVKMFGGVPQVSADPSVLHGMAGSPGVVRGVARVIRSLADAERLGHGEVLVTETTAPPWTPLFARAAAVVTDAGGILSHCAVVAREYLIPAVVGTGAGTKAIQDGQLVEVDGTAGTVRIVEA